MKEQRFLKILLFCLFLPLFNLNASSIIFQVFQNDKSAESILETTKAFNQSILSEFFDYGDIACDAPAAIFEDEESGSEILDKTLKEASDSYMDYLVVIKINYDRSNLLNPESTQLAGVSSVSWSSIKVKVNEPVGEGCIKPDLSAISLKSEKGEKEVEKFVAQMAKEIKAGLKK